MSKIHDFAMKWFDIFRNKNTTDMEIVENQSFADDCFSFEFKMDCGEAITNAFPEKNVFNDWKELDKVIDSIDDVQLIGLAIFSNGDTLITGQVRENQLRMRPIELGLLLHWEDWKD